MESPVRYLTVEDVAGNRPVHAVWELTLACDLKCRHCGSRAGRRRPDELTTAECLEIVRQLAGLGTREVTLIGGEAYLRPDWTRIIRAIVEANMLCTLQTGARNLTEKRVQEAAEAGLGAAGVSIDGLRSLHDALRGVPGSYDAAFEALGRLRRYGIVTSVNTQITAQVLPQLRELMQQIIAAGAKNWQVQLTVAMGRAADNPDVLLQPYQLLELMPLLAELYEEGVQQGLLLQPGNNIGFFGPYEHLLRGSGDSRVHFTSCTAGRNAIGIEADGTIKGCPSLPTASYAGGNIRTMPLEEIWNTTEELAFARKRGRDELWGFCAGCYYADVCLGGCTWTAHSLLGRRGNNPYCHHRALELSKRGLRERIVPAESARGVPFDHGRFDLRLETESGDEVDMVPSAHRLIQIQRHPPHPVAGIASPPGDPRSPATKPGDTKVSFLELCRSCRRHVFPGTETCPHCGANVVEAARLFTELMARATEAHRRLRELMRADTSNSR